MPLAVKTDFRVFLRGKEEIKSWPLGNLKKEDRGGFGLRTKTPRRTRRKEEVWNYSSDVTPSERE